MPNKYGVRIPAILHPRNVILIKQTVLRPGKPHYVIDHKEDGAERDKFVDMDDTVGIADAVRRALRGELDE